MTKAEKRGWGIYHEMVDSTGGYAYVVNLTEGKEQAKYDCFYGANLSSMLEYSEYISTQTNAMFTKMITGEMDIKDFNVLIGEQATGKSTVAKEIYFFRIIKH